MNDRAIALGLAVVFGILYFMHTKFLEDAKYEIDRDIKSEEKLRNYTIHFWISKGLIALAVLSIMYAIRRPSLTN
ncbi:hypothetical protein CCB80_04935 [Armatimonadetes bacterium Uphvl-Ar1]|nr:hypothetical protein CCB80_04935 [Armatimonadetes bacterium Uphvl-Ar1]